MQNIRKLRTINDCLAEIKKLDKNSRISRYAIERLILARKIYYRKVGAKYLVDLDEILEYFDLVKAEE